MDECADCNSTTGHNDFRFVFADGPVQDGEEGVLAYVDYIADKQEAEEDATGKKNPFL